VDLTSTVALEELVLLAAATVGAWGHWRALRLLRRRCAGDLLPAEVVLCRLYSRHERVRCAIKLALVYAALWLLFQPSDMDMGGWEWWGRLAYRLVLVGIALALDWESYCSTRDRQELEALGQMPHEHEVGR
jgi:hypothetical protein